MAITHVFMLVRTESKRFPMPVIQTAYNLLRDDTEILGLRYKWAFAAGTDDIAGNLAAGVPHDSEASVQVLTHNTDFGLVKQALVEHVKEEVGRAIERRLGLVKMEWVPGNTHVDQSALVTVINGYPSTKVRFEIVSVRVEKGAAG